MLELSPFRRWTNYTSGIFIAPLESNYGWLEFFPWSHRIRDNESQLYYDRFWEPFFQDVRWCISSGLIGVVAFSARGLIKWKLLYYLRLTMMIKMMPWDWLFMSEHRRLRSWRVIKHRMRPTLCWSRWRLCPPKMWVHINLWSAGTSRIMLRRCR